LIIRDILVSLGSNSWQKYLFSHLLKKQACFRLNDRNWYRGRGARQRSAKPSTAVRICSVPQNLINPVLRDLFLKMITEQEKAFIDYWTVQRGKKKTSLRRFTVGFPLAVMILVVLFANILAGWHKRAAMIIQSNGSIILMVIIAAVGIVVFMTYFSSKHEWDQNEQRYQELLKKQLNDSKAALNSEQTS
jgi:heme/copper-type cytochrome/quinol oxidase subunit 4